MQEAEVVLSVLRERGWVYSNPVAHGINRWRARCLESGHAGFGGRLRGKGPHPHGIRDLAVQPTLLGVTPHRGERESRLQGQVAQVFTIIWNGEVCVMQRAETLLEIIRTLESRVR